MHHVSDLRNLLTVFVVLSVFALLTMGTARAQEQPMEAPPANSGAISVDVGIDFTTAYFFRGALQEDDGLIVQPYGELGATVVEEGTGMIESVDLYAGIWSSFHDEQTGAMTTNDGPDSWYEADLYAGASVGLPAGFSADLSYIAYTSPNDAFNTIQEIDLGLSFDDSEMWGDTGFALNPSATLAHEIDNTLLGSDEGTYLGVGVAPSFPLLESEDYPLTLDVPVTVGLGLDNYFEDANDHNETFGFASVKPTVSMPLRFMPDRYGSWEVAAGVEFLFLGDTNEALNNGDDFQTIGTIGLSMSY